MNESVYIACILQILIKVDAQIVFTLFEKGNFTTSFIDIRSFQLSQICYHSASVCSHASNSVHTLQSSSYAGIIPQNFLYSTEA